MFLNFLVLRRSQDYYNWYNHMAPVRSLKSQSTLLTSQLCSLCSFWQFSQEMKEFRISAKKGQSNIQHFMSISYYMAIQQGFRNKNFCWGRKRDKCRAGLFGQVTQSHLPPCLSEQLLCKHLRVFVQNNHNCQAPSSLRCQLFFTLSASAQGCGFFPKCLQTPSWTTEQLRSEKPRSIQR